MHSLFAQQILLHSKHMSASVFLSYIVAYPALPLSIALLIVLCYTAYLHHKLSRFMRGENGKSLESTIRTYLDHVDNLRKHDELIAEHALKLDKRLNQAIRNVSTVRFKAFDQNASNQSFAIALVNELGNGVILSSFAKPVVKYESQHDLTEEEIAVLEEARESHKRIS
jgi:hypothetical protein